MLPDWLHGDICQYISDKCQYENSSERKTHESHHHHQNGNQGSRRPEKRLHRVRRCLRPGPDHLPVVWRVCRQLPRFERPEGLGTETSQCVHATCHLPPAKGLLIIGIAGTGKSMSAKASAALPLAIGKARPNLAFVLGATVFPRMKTVRVVALLVSALIAEQVSQGQRLELTASLSQKRRHWWTRGQQR